jgi:inosine-uridine nucleoside N-ribohydrolase
MKEIEDGGGKITLLAIGLDVTRQETMPAEEVRERFGKVEFLKPVLDFTEVWFSHCQKITFHDPLPAVCLFDYLVCEFEKGDVSIELEDKEKLGFTHWTQNTIGPHEIATKVDVERY